MSLPVYIVHYKNNTERKDYLNGTPLAREFNCIWNESFQSPAEIPNNIKYSITDKEICVFLAHKEILNHIYTNKIEDFLILEDDALVDHLPDPCEYVRKILKEFKSSDCDIIFIAGILSSNNPSQGEEIISTNVPQQSLCSHAYIVKTNRIKEILDNFSYNLPIDHEYNRLIHVLKLKVGWAFPGFAQGTITGKYRSNLRGL